MAFTEGSTRPVKGVQSSAIATSILDYIFRSQLEVITGDQGDFFMALLMAEPSSPGIPVMPVSWCSPEN